MKINSYLFFNGDCKEAFQFYGKLLGGQIVSTQTYAETPAASSTPENWQDKIIHVRLAVGDQVLMGSDAPPDRFQRAQGFSVSLSVSTHEEAERVFKGLAEKGTVHMPIQETFWAERFGMLVDQYGTPWMVNCEKKT